VLKRVAHALRLHRISTRPSPRRIEVRSGHELLATSDRALELHETGSRTRFYLPREDVRTDLLTPGRKRSHCPFKGDATYYSAPQAADAFWAYEAPSERDALPIAGRLAPDPRRVDVRVLER
jgi:uncharacterized protein (DUF427 family)